MIPVKRAVILAGVCLMASWPLGDRPAIAQSVAPGNYLCNASGNHIAGLDFTVAGNTYTASTGQTGTISVDPASGNIIFQGAEPQSDYQGQYSPGPPPQIAFLTVTGGATNYAGPICQIN